MLESIKNILEILNTLFELVGKPFKKGKDSTGTNPAKRTVIVGGIQVGGNVTINNEATATANNASNPGNNKQTADVSVNTEYAIVISG